MAHPETSQPSSSGDVSRPELTREQQQTVLRAVSEIVQAAVRGEQVRLSDATLGGTAPIPVFGCFVSIKRQGHLRGCCGFLGRRAALLEALRESAVTSATGDVRLPSVSISELPHLQFEVWLLYGRQPMRSQGEARIQEVEVGRHGLQIQLGQARGLLLPGVAQDHHLSAEEFLRQVCIKAGLPPTAWREEDAQLSTFEGYVIRGPFDRSVLTAAAADSQPCFQDEELEMLVRFCRDNVLAISRGAVPNYYLAGCADGSVHGINLQIEVAGRRDPLQLARLSLRKPVPVQASLFQLCETAGHRLRAEGRQQLTKDNLQIHLGLLNDPAVHGTVAEPDLAGMDPTRRALLVSQGAKSAWTFDPQSSAETAPAIDRRTCRGHVARVGRDPQLFGPGRSGADVRGERAAIAARCRRAAAGRGRHVLSQGGGRAVPHAGATGADSRPRRGNAGMRHSFHTPVGSTQDASRPMS